MLNKGDTAPEFSLTDQHGEALTLKHLLTQGDLILYFYPIDFSPVCTAEACSFRDHYGDVTSVGSQIVGVSPQDAATHARFASTYNIPFPLLADPRKQAVRAYGVDGPLGFGVRRVTFLIDQTGVIKNRVVSDLFVGSHLDLLKQTVADRQGAAH